MLTYRIQYKLSIRVFHITGDLTQNSILSFDQYPIAGAQPKILTYSKILE